MDSYILGITTSFELIEEDCDYFIFFGDELQSRVKAA